MTAPTGIQVENVTAWMADRIDGLAPPLDFELITGGASNLTFKVSDTTGGTWVLRRPPTGHVLASAHDMAREHRIIAALADTGVPVPPTASSSTSTEPSTRQHQHQHRPQHAPAHASTTISTGTPPRHPPPPTPTAA